jgi:hypothetical protein
MVRQKHNIQKIKPGCHNILSLSYIVRELIVFSFKIRLIFFSVLFSKAIFIHVVSFSAALACITKHTRSYSLEQGRLPITWNMNHTTTTIKGQTFYIKKMDTIKWKNVLMNYKSDSQNLEKPRVPLLIPTHLYLQIVQWKFICCQQFQLLQF